eukprot:scaffold1318_cov388-Prasinococcus_capsulatus_cf.AAC.52
MDGYAWMMTANSPNSDIRPIGPDDDLDSFDKIISYVLNVEVSKKNIIAMVAMACQVSWSAFSQRLQNDPNWRNNPRVRFHDVRAEETYTQEVRWAMNEKHLGMLELIHRLRLEPTPATFEAAGKPVQKSQTAKHTNDNEYYELTEQYCQERLQGGGTVAIPSHARSAMCTSAMLDGTDPSATAGTITLLASHSCGNERLDSPGALPFEIYLIAGVLSRVVQPGLAAGPIHKVLAVVEDSLFLAQ